MAYQVATFPYAGHYLDGVLDTETGETFLSLSSAAEAIGKDHKSIGYFLASKRPEALPFKRLALGKKRIGASTYTLVPVPAAVAYWTYWVGKRNKEAKALLAAIAVADLDSTIKGANGETVTESEKEAVRVSAYEHFLTLYKQWEALTRSEWTSVWGDSQLMAECELALTQLSPEDRAKLTYGRYQPIWDTEGKTIISWVDTQHKEPTRLTAHSLRS